MPATNTISVRGFRELNRAFGAADKTLKRELRDRLKEAAEPVRRSAEDKASTEIRNLSANDPWSRMKVGVTTRLVYVAPKERGVRSRGGGPFRRPNLAGLLMDRAMQPALDENRDKVVAELEDMLDDIGRAWELA